MLRRNEHDLIGFQCQVVAAPMCRVNVLELSATNQIRTLGCRETAPV